MTRAIALLCVGLLWGTAAGPLYAQPRNADPGEEVRILESKNTQRGRLVIDGASYVLTPDTRLVDAWGRKISLDDLPVAEVGAAGRKARDSDVTVQIRSVKGDGLPRLLELRYLPSRAR
ncbi:MAG: hypothetical protein HRU02_11610 [Myxococcales bacterium]|nr:hypothetical protein [Myxococcales bacterium]